MFRSCLVICLIAGLSGCIQPIVRPVNTTNQTDFPTKQASDRKACAITQPAAQRFIPPSPYPEYPSLGEFWYGSNELWTALPQEGSWHDLPHNADGYTQKLAWWREGYFWLDEPQPKLTVTGRRLDGEAPPLQASRATNAFAEDIQSAMLVGVDIPTTGCWEISGVYSDTQLSFVVWVEP